MSDDLLHHADNRFAVDGDVLVRNLAARVRELEGITHAHGAEPNKWAALKP